MINEKIQDVSQIEWRRINTRKVEHLLGVEFIHDLYNRHDPGINSIRFRNTMTTWKDGIVNSHAPASEWGYLGSLLGSRYYHLDTLTLRNTKRLYKNPRKDYWALTRILKKNNLKSYSDGGLLSLLINVQSIMLGDLYLVNFVQIEHGLNWAIDKILTEILHDQDMLRNSFVKIVQTTIPTFSQREKRHLGWIVRKWIILDKIGLYREKKARQDVDRHSKKYAYMYSAYGENPKTLDTFWEDFLKLYYGKVKTESLWGGWNILSTEAKTELSRLDNRKLDILIPLLVQGGIYRDTTKALLGLGLRYRFDILEEMVRRGFETSENLKYYLLADIVKLIDDGKKLDSDVITKRRDGGVILSRFEYLESEDIGNFYFLKKRNEREGSDKQKLILQGVCASLGDVVGRAKIILNKGDIFKVDEGDIMVAIGTDFDVLDAMYRAAAVVTEEGGILSHASVVCRELKKPCIISVSKATHIIKDGMKVRVFATEGRIEILS